MARGRLISRSFSTSEKRARLYQEAGKLAEFCQALFPLLVAHSDDFGRLAGDVFTVRHAIDPSSPRRESDFTAALTALHQVGLIEWYEANGRKWIQINNFDAHQTGLHKRTKSHIPEASGRFPEVPQQEKRTEQKGTEEKGSRRDKAAPDPRVSSLIRFFDALHRERHGTGAEIHGQKDGGLIKGMLARRDEPEIQALMRAFFASSDTFIQQAGHTIGVFKSQVGKLIPLIAKAKPKPVEEPYVSPREDFNRQYGLAGPEGWREECAAQHEGRCNDAFAHWQKSRAGAA